MKRKSSAGIRPADLPLDRFRVYEDTGLEAADPV